MNLETEPVVIVVLNGRATPPAEHSSVRARRGQLVVWWNRHVNDDAWINFGPKTPFDQAKFTVPKKGALATRVLNPIQVDDIEYSYNPDGKRPVTRSDPKIIVEGGGSIDEKTRVSTKRGRKTKKSKR